MIDYLRIREKWRKGREGTAGSRVFISFSDGLKYNKLNKQ
jgi:hypothetical protein